MKKFSTTIIVFIVIFITSYIILSYSVDSLRIDLDANTYIYFVNTISYKYPIKILISLLPSLIVSICYFLKYRD